MGWEYPRLTTMTLLNEIQIKLSRLYSFINVDLFATLQPYLLYYSSRQHKSKKLPKKVFLAKVNGLTIGNFWSERNAVQQGTKEKGN